MSVRILVLAMLLKLGVGGGGEEVGVDSGKCSDSGSGFRSGMSVLAVLYYQMDCMQSQNIG